MAADSSGKDGKEDKVGYKRPPKSGRFKPGRSGNPRGRPKGTKNFNALLRSALDEKVTARIDGKTKAISKLEAIVLKLVNDAAGGDPKARAEVIGLLPKLEGPAPDYPVEFTFKFDRPNQQDDDDEGECGA
jgi:hypothetical protein